MISRRSFLGTGAAAAVVAGGVWAADATHRLDDAARAVGITPRPTPDPRDLRLLTDAAQDQNLVLATVEATAARHPALALTALVGIGRQHLDALGGSGEVPGARPVPASPEAAARALAKTYRSASGRRAADAVTAVSPDLALVLASMSAGLAQCAREVGELR